eukprot:6185358-Pleurochrysis_carterae.AAC.1
MDNCHVASCSRSHAITSTPCKRVALWGWLSGASTPMNRKAMYRYCFSFRPLSWAITLSLSNFRLLSECRRSPATCPLAVALRLHAACRTNMHASMRTKNEHGKSKGGH